MKKTIAIVGALDTKGEEYAFLKNEIEKLGCQTFVINVGVLGKPAFPPDVSSEEVAEAGGKSLSELIQLEDRGTAMDIMVRGVEKISAKYYEMGKFDGMISMGGGGGTITGTSAMRALPVGVPKLMVSTVASGDTSAYVGTTDITMMPSIVDVSGLNIISKTIFSNAAGAIVGMVKNKLESKDSERKLIAATMFGNTTRAVDNARKILEKNGYEVLVFHATGTGGRTMEMLINSGYFAGVLDMTTTEWADEICGGVLSAGPERLDAAAQNNVPMVVTPACIDMCNFWAPDTVPSKYENRKFYHWNPNVTLMRTTPEENAQLGKIFAEKLNKTQGPVEFFIPLRGFSEIDAPGKDFWWPEANEAFINSLKENLRPDIKVIEMDFNVNDPEFSGAVANSLLKMLEK